MSEFWKRKMRTYFKTCDFDKDGYISEEDFVDMARRSAEACNANDETTEYYVQSMANVWKSFMKAGDIEKDGRLTASILIESMRQQMYDPGLMVEMDRLIRGVFGLMDVNQDGYLQPEEYHIMIRNAGVPEGTFDEKLAFKAIDVNGDGKLSIDEFVAAFLDFMFSQDENSPNNFFFGPLVD